jgi:hypothetical protein
MRGVGDAGPVNRLMDGAHMTGVANTGPVAVRASRSGATPARGPPHVQPTPTSRLAVACAILEDHGCAVSNEHGHPSEQ